MCACDHSVMSDSLPPFWTVALQAPVWELSGKYWSGLPYLPPGDLPNPEIKPESPVSPALQVDSLPSKTSGKPQKSSWNCSKGGLLEIFHTIYWTSIELFNC